MDYMGYSSNWAEGDDNIPSRRIVALGMQWRLDLGEHPYSLEIGRAFWKLNPFADLRRDDISPELQVRPIGTVHGHNTLTDESYADLFGIDPNIPISPLFVRDLCGRTIYIGYGPEAKGLEEWNAYDIEAEKILATVTFPRCCRVVDDTVEGADLLEQVFFTKFRCLDMSVDYDIAPAGNPDTRVLGTYAHANLYPYKARLDTFYIDGWKLPQTQMVFARPNVSTDEAEAAAKELLSKWKEKQPQQDYETFHEVNGGETWFNDLFNRGCTVIPTFEACNGLNKVSANFELEDYWPGRYVPGLHAVAEEVDDMSPAGTILAVLEPGYVIANRVKPAVVIISNGAGYFSEHLNDPPAFVPNLFLPHQRTVAQWNACWLPTHPSHFELPAIWGWDTQTGRFLQKEGPLWDPLHYYYASVPLVLKAFETPMAENRWLVKVPEEMKLRFYPIVEMQGFDVHDEFLRLSREELGLLPYSGCKFVPSQQIKATVGYHPMPIAYEYELNSWWFPELDPRNRLKEEPPEILVPLIAPVIATEIEPEEYMEHVVAQKYSDWLSDITRLKKAENSLRHDYPELFRYIGTEDLLQLYRELASSFLTYADPKELDLPLQAQWPRGMDEMADLELLQQGFYDALYNLREQARKQRILRHKLFMGHYEIYNMANWQSQTVDFMREMLDMETTEQERVKKAEQELMPAHKNSDQQEQTPKQPSGVLESALMGVDDL